MSQDEIEEYKGIRCIYPPTAGILSHLCSSCKRNVNTDCGFVDMSMPQSKGYLCSRCATIAIGGNRCCALLQFAQEKYRKSKISKK
jgi:hypothetical protein